ncbi:MAG: hypothetical protein HRU21_04230 [Pseudomonadales bacterium]|nr:hypothetical protein [Pseudomonadales bacterium]
MLAKGHHLPNLSLVIVLDADSSLVSSDYRAVERFGQLMMQVTGRAGREAQQGLALIQTHYSEHPILQTLIQQGYAAMADEQLAERKLLQLPPFAFQAMLRIEDKSERNAAESLERMRDYCSQQALPVEPIGPFPAPLQRRANYYRYQLVLQAASRKALAHTLENLLDALHTEPSLQIKASQRFSVDVDPQASA